MDAAIAEFEVKLGVRPIFGGYHKSQGTKNALLNLDKGMYLELLAADHTNTEIKPPRWMGIDVLEKSQITRWALKSEDLERDSHILKGHQNDMGEIKGGSRVTSKGALLKWKMIMPLPEPEVEILPFIVDWSQSETHPHHELPEMNCQLVELYATHSTPKIYDAILQQLNFDLRIENKKETSINALIKCPKGLVII